MRQHRPWRSHLQTIVMTLACGALLAACSCGTSEPKVGPTTATPTTKAAVASEPVVTAPLTGAPVSDPSVLGRPALVVKIDNADGRSAMARPQLGLATADVVFEERVEGSVTRLMAVFHSQGSNPVGPIRSARSTDVPILSMLNRPLFAWSGANPTFAALIRSSPLIDLGYDAATSAYERRNETGHVAPHNLYAWTDKLWALAPADAKPPTPLFIYRKPGELGAGARPVTSLHVDFAAAGGAPADWVWNGASRAFDRSQRGTPHVDETGKQVAAKNVIVQFVEYTNTGITDVTGAAVPEAALVGSGTCWVVTGGKIIEGTWKKPSNEAITTYTDSAGKPIGLAPGQTWVELSPPGGASVAP